MDYCKLIYCSNGIHYLIDNTAGQQIVNTNLIDKRAYAHFMRRIDLEMNI